MLQPSGQDVSIPLQQGQFKKVSYWNFSQNSNPSPPPCVLESPAGECIIETRMQISDYQKNEMIEVLFEIPTGGIAFDQKNQ